jgi:hypothetical protein
MLLLPNLIDQALPLPSKVKSKLEIHKSAEKKNYYTQNILALSRPCHHIASNWHTAD